MFMFDDEMDACRCDQCTFDDSRLAAWRLGKAWREFLIVLHDDARGTARSVLRFLRVKHGR
jgi:hypothetical protein